MVSQEINLSWQKEVLSVGVCSVSNTSTLHEEFCSLGIEIPMSVLFTWPYVPEPKTPIISKVNSICWRVSKPLTRIPRQNSSVADIGFCWTEFVQIAFESMLWCSWQRKKFLCLSVYLPLPFFEFSFHLRFIFITLFLSTINFFQSQKDKSNEAAALNCCWTVETIIWFSFISPSLLYTYCSIS